MSRIKGAGMNLQKIEARIHELEDQARDITARLSRLKAIREACGDPVLAPDLEALGIDPSSVPQLSGDASNGAGGTKSTNYDRIAAFFRRSNNAWATSKQVSQSTGIHLDAARDVLGRSSREKFEARQKAGSPVKEFRLSGLRREPAIGGLAHEEGRPAG
jgi:hypothetical protein